jgi:hypothetical protein
VPGATPDTTPNPPEELTVATEGLEVAHVPPAGEADSVVLLPEHTVAVPAIAPGPDNTVTVSLPEQPPGVLYVTIPVPDVTPVTTPEDVTETTELEPDHVAPAPGQVSVVLAPAQIESVPGQTGAAPTVTTAVEEPDGQAE